MATAEDVVTWSDDILGLAGLVIPPGQAMIIGLLLSPGVPIKEITGRALVGSESNRTNYADYNSGQSSNAKPVRFIGATHDVFPSNEVRRCYSLFMTIRSRRRGSCDGFVGR